MKHHIPITYGTFLIAALAIAGIFPFAGFFSKDEILFHALTDGNYFYWGIGAVAAFITAFYMFRAVYMVFYGESRVDHHVAHHIHESPPVMTIPLMILAFLSIVGGLVGFPIIEGAHRFKDFLSPSITPVGHGGHPPVSLELGLMAFRMGVAAIGIYVAYRLYILYPDVPGWLAEKFKVPYDLIYHKYYMDEIYDAIIVEPIKEGSNLLWAEVDNKVVDGAVNGSASVVAWLSMHLRKLETGFVQNYALAIVLGVTLVVSYFLGYRIPSNFEF